MRKSLTTVLAATCLLLSGCGGASSDAPHCCATLTGTWVGAQGDLTIRIVVDTATSCSRQYGYCEASGTGTYTRTGGSSGSFSLNTDYFVDVGQSAVINMGDFGAGVYSQFGGTFDSPTEISGTLYDISSEPSPLGVGRDGVPMTLRRQ
jgi:hypothetical protein